MHASLYARVCVCSLLRKRITTYLPTTAPVTKQGESPLAVAVHESNLDMVKCLVKECNADVNCESSI